MCPLFQKYFNPQVRSNKLVNSVVYHLWPSILASGIHPCLSRLLRILSRSRMLVQFSLTCIFHHVWKKDQFIVFTLENELNLCIFTHVPLPHSKLQVQFFENPFPPKAKNKGAEEAMICFIKIQSENMKMIWNFSLFIICMCCMIYNFCECDGFTVLWVISIEQCGIKCIVPPLLPWSFDTKVTLEKIANIMKDGLL